MYNEEAQQQGLAVWSHSDAAQFVLKSKTCFDDGQLACVAITSGDHPDAHDVLLFLWMPAVVLVSLGLKQQRFRSESAAQQPAS